MITKAKIKAAPKVDVRYKKQSMFVQVMGRLAQNKVAMAGLIGIGIIVLACVFAPLVAPYDPKELNLLNDYAAPSWEHICGTDGMGRDIFSRLLYGGRYSLALGICASLFSAVCGIVIGSCAGYFGKRVDNIIMRICDVMQAIPGMLLSIVISTALGSGFFNTVLALSIGGIAGSTRMIRGQILSVRDSEYLDAARSINCSTTHIMFKQMLPNVISPVIVSTTMGVGGTIMGASGLSYIGLGIQPPTPEWGAMLSEGRNLIRQYPHLVIFPGICIALTILCINLFGDGLRDAIDPKLKR